MKLKNRNEFFKIHEIYYIKFDTNVFAIFIMFSNTYFSLYSANMLLNMKRLNCSNSKKKKT